MPEHYDERSAARQRFWKSRAGSIRTQLHPLQLSEGVAWPLEATPQRSRVIELAKTSGQNAAKDRGISVPSLAGGPEIQRSLQLASDLV